MNQDSEQLKRIREQVAEAQRLLAQALEILNRLGAP